MPKPVDIDPTSEGIISTFVLACRERQIVEGMLLPLSTSNITSVVSVRPVAMPRWLLDDIIFEIDSIELDFAKNLQKGK